jgi:hypothetical protein
MLSAERRMTGVQAALFALMAFIFGVWFGWAVGNAQVNATTPCTIHAQYYGAKECVR